MDKILTLKSREDRRVRAGHLWVYSNEIAVDKTSLRDFEPGEVATLCAASGEPLGRVYVNPQSLISARILTRDSRAVIDTSWLITRLANALALRDGLYDKPFYRAVHGEADGLPGLVVDRYDKLLVVQIGTAGMEAMREQLIEALNSVFSPDSILLRNDIASRELEGLEQSVDLVQGQFSGLVEVHEGDLKFAVDPIAGQKTGWFYDQRENRLGVRRFAKGARVLDVCSYVGGWGVNAAAAGASDVLCVDASASALAQAESNAKLNGLSLRTKQGDALLSLKELHSAGEQFDVIVLDPPALIKRKRDAKHGSNHYRSLNQWAMRLLGKSGVLISCSCSHHLSAGQLQDVMLQASRQQGHDMQLLARGQQGFDHPEHPAMPETAYLKTVVAHIRHA